MFDEASLRQACETPGYCGPLADDRPHITVAWVKPFIWAILLYRGGIRRDELLACLTPLVPTDDLRCGVFDSLLGLQRDDRNLLELRIDEAIAEEVEAGSLRYNDARDLWVLTGGEGKRTAISCACTMNSQLPFHLLDEEAMAQLPAPF
ncbi:hypothetical protein [Vulcanococcus sp.]|uniref:hypothetical protein n=1 Tax=Vulcanococcus sp. TaxID=2856995 RepID=UPI003C753AB8